MKNFWASGLALFVCVCVVFVICMIAALSVQAQDNSYYNNLNRWVEEQIEWSEKINRELDRQIEQDMYLYEQLIYRLGRSLDYLENYEYEGFDFEPLPWPELNLEMIKENMEKEQRCLDNCIDA